MFRNLAIVVLGILLIGLIGCTSLKTPDIKGVVLDAETGKPIEGAYVIASWGRIYSGPGGQVGGKDFKRIRSQTNKDGAFTIPAYTVINWVPWPFGQGGSFFMAIYTHGYKHKKFTFDETSQFQIPKHDEFKKKKQDGTIIFKLDEMKDPDTFDKNGDEIYGLVKEDLSYKLIDYQLFVSKFPMDKRVPGYRLSIGSIYEEIGDYEKALMEYKKIIKDFPDSRAVKEASERILKLKGKRKIEKE
ncbi:MAG: hypothetical protein ABIB41_01210 [Nitrospirota bacterium]